MSQLSQEYALRELGALQIEPAMITIFGASGDLTKRKLVPALFSLACEQMLPETVKIVGVARSEMSDEQFRQQLREGIEQYGRLKPGQNEHWSRFKQRLSYLSGGYDDPETYRRLAERLQKKDGSSEGNANRLFYLSIPPSVYRDVIAHLGQSGANHSPGGWSRLIVEKPFGHDLESAQRLNDLIHEHFSENQVYRIDHYLGKETVQNILTFRFANTIFEPVWNRNYIDHVQISVLESVEVGYRAGYYDQAGVVRDMFQNHLLQLLALTAMEPPVAINAKALRDEKVKVLQAIRPSNVSDGVWGQYRGYREEKRVAAGSTTPTYLGLKLFLDNWRWQGVPFYLRSGKNLAKKTTEITLYFKEVPHLLFQDSAGVSANRLSICIQPHEGMHLSFETKIPGAGLRTDPVDMEFHYGENFGEHALPDAYERLLMDALHGDASLFTRRDEIELAWGFIDPLMLAWDNQADPPLAFYEPGTNGPPEADEFLAREGRAWCHCCLDDH
jgi:glucose-6-phosphate 1-dehydrogenase